MSFTSFSKIMILLFFLVSCAEKEDINRGEGYLDVNGGKIWYKVSGEGNKTPLVMLHGGPGYPSYYLDDLNALSKERPIIMFDQLGSGRSDAITDTTLMTVDNHVDQVHKLISALDLNEFYLYGHSWGTMLGMDYYLKYPSKVNGLVLASPCISTEIWERDSRSLISTMPDSTQVVLQNDIRGISQDSVSLAQAVETYWNTFYARKHPTTANFDSTVAGIGYNVYTHMWGENDYLSEGTLKDYDRTGDLSSIEVPTLFIGGEYDIARPSTLDYYQSLTSNSKTAVIKDAGHVTMNDNPTEDVKVISDFLADLDGN